MLRLYSCVLLFCALLVAGCGGEEHVEPPPRPEWRGILERALQQAGRDSVALATGKFRAAGVMRMEFGRDDSRVAIDDRFNLVKDTGQNYRTEPLEHRVSGDTTLLDDMYTFRTSTGDAREQEHAQMTGISFGAHFPSILRAVLAGGENGCTLRDSNAVVDGRSAMIFSFAAEGQRGQFAIGHDSCDLINLSLEHDNSFVIGSYQYSMVTKFVRPDGRLLLPLETTSSFSYSRLMSDGTGTIVVRVDSVVVLD